MSKPHKIMPGLVLFALPYVPVIAAYFVFRRFVPGVSFSDHRDALGAAIASYSGTTIAILIAALTFVIGIGGRNMHKVKAYGYMTTVILMYALTFAELGMVFFMGLFLMATSKEPINFLPTLSIGFAATSLLHISLLLIQLFNFSKKN